MNLRAALAKLKDEWACQALHSRKVSVPQWIKQSVSRQAGVIVAGSLAAAALLLWLLGKSAILPYLPMRLFVIGIVCLVPAAGLFAAWITERLVGSRLAHLVEVIDGAGPHDDLLRIRDLGSDEVGAIGQAVNGLLARMTSMRASMIDQKRELGEAQRELELKASLAEKNAELAQRRNERATLFDIMRVTTSSTQLDQVLDTLVERVGQQLRLREVVLFLHDATFDGFVVAATHGFAQSDALRGRTLRLGEGISGRAGLTRQPIVVDDLSTEDGYLGFWGAAERTGALAAVPILYSDKLLGVLTVTHPEHEPITDVHVKLLCAIADNAALAIRNAQLFERMRELSATDELTGLANRRMLTGHLEREIDRSRRFDKPLSLLAIEVDQLSELDQPGEQTQSDALVREVAALLVGGVRKIDTVARVGHDSFVVLLPRTDLREATAAGEKLRKAVLAHTFEGREQTDLSLTLSVGTTQLTTGDDAAGTSFAERAEQALQTARQSGRNRLVASGESVPELEPPRPQS